MSKLRELGESLIAQAVSPVTEAESLPKEISGVGDRASEDPTLVGYHWRTRPPTKHPSVEHFLSVVPNSTESDKIFTDHVSKLKGPVYVYDSENGTQSEKLLVHALTALKVVHFDNGEVEVRSGHLHGHPTVARLHRGGGLIVHSNKHGLHVV